jgi:hypothetical protein
MRHRGLDTAQRGSVGDRLADIDVVTAALATMPVVFQA